MIERKSWETPGFNCGPEGRDCKHDPKGDHGIDGGSWWYVVSDGPRAVSLMVLANRYPESVARPLPECLNKPMATGLTQHDADPDGRRCEWVEGGRCHCDSSYMAGGRLWEERGDPTQFEQPEAFWLALEAELKGES